jgi:hypothetical protein
MSSRDDDLPASAKPAPKAGEAAKREARLAQALRANLRRRKAAGRPGHEPEPKGG